MRISYIVPAIGAAMSLALGGCQTAYADRSQPAITGDQAQLPPPSTLDFAQGVCGECHAVAPPWLSPNPLAPTFVDIANRPGLSEGSVASWLKDAHNYPEQMDVDLSEEDAEALADYMLTLRSVDYVRLPS